MLAWMGYAMFAAAALGVAAWLVDFSVAGRLARRRVLWAGVFLASAIGPVVFSVTRDVPTGVAEENGAAAPTASWRKEAIVSDRVLGSVWLAVSAIVALWLVATQRRLRRRLRGCPPRVVDGERVLVSCDFGPAVAGVVRPQIVLPEWALAMPESDRRIIVAHETEHRQARDPLLAAMALLLVAAFPWNAALWWQLRRLRLAIEIDCDRRVVSRRGHDAHAYGVLLLAMRERAHRLTPTPAMAMAAMRSGLGRRVEAIVDGRPRSAVRRVSAVAAAVVLAAGIVSVPAPRLSIARAAVVDPSAATARFARYTTPSGAIVVVRGPSIRVLLPPKERTGERRDGRGSSASTVERGWDTIGVAPNRRILQSRAAPNRWMLLPDPDSLRPSPP